MGFGILFFGFLMMIELMVSTSAEYMLGIDLFPDLAGYFLMLTAACRLSPYNKGFARFRVALYPLLGVSTVSFAVGLFSAFGVAPSVLDFVFRVANGLSVLLQPVAFFFLFSGIVRLADSVELPKLSFGARLLAVMSTAYYLCQIVFTVVSVLPTGFPENMLSVVNYVLTLVYLLFVILTEVLLFRCYMFICYEGEERVSPTDAVNPIAKFFNKFKKGNGD